MSSIRLQPPNEHPMDDASSETPPPTKKKLTDEWPTNEPMPPSHQKLYYPYAYTSGKETFVNIPDNEPPAKPNEMKETKGKTAKKEAKEAKAVSDKLKLNMANERTFSKYVLMGMQMGAIGTFVLLTLDRHHNTTWGVLTLGFAWLVGFAIAFYGMYTYYGRRRALITGDLSHDPASGRAFVPALIIIGLIAVVTSSLVYVGIAGLPAHSTTTSIPHSNVVSGH